MGRFKVGDMVTIVRVTMIGPKDDVAEWNNHVGETHTVESIEGRDSYKLAMYRNPIWLDDELDFPKNKIVIDILNDL